MKKVLQGLQILYRYNEDADMAAMHDTILCKGPKPEDMTEDDEKMMVELGWKYDSVDDHWEKFV